jgi:hypothetical protein
MKKTGFNDKVSLGRKVALKKTAPKIEKIEQAVETIHQDEPTSKASVTLPKSLYKKMKQRTLDLDMGVSEYFRTLLEKDLTD